MPVLKLSVLERVDCRIATKTWGQYLVNCLLKDTVKIPKISPEAYILQRPFLRGLFLEGLIFGGAYLREGNLRFKIDWASLIVGSKFTVFALFYCVFEGNFPNTVPQGAYIWRKI